ncbi:MAG: HIT domain-containing protein, partial [Phycisphaerales bacterium]|nr:HIT domain-containing protein [Phycisphaerales bacterium]
GVPTEGGNEGERGRGASYGNFWTGGGGGDCIFCKIAAGTIPSFKVFEDDVVLAFLDIGPLVPGHTLVIPKAHHATVMETPAEVLATISARIPALSRAVLAATGAKACHVLVNNGSEAMQSVAHLHYHILPRKAGDAFRIPWNAGTLDKSTASTLAENIKAQLGA